MKALMIAVPASGGSFASGDEANLFGFGTDTITEANAQISALRACTFSNLRTRIISGGSGTNNFQFRDAGANGNQLATRSGTGDCEDTVNSDSLSQDDLFNFAYTDTGTNSVCSWVAANIEMASGYGAFQGAASYGGTVFDAAGATRYICLSGSFDADGDLTLANTAFKIRGYTHWDEFAVKIISNARPEEAVFNAVINGSSGSESIGVPIGATGIFRTSVLGDALADGNTVAVSIDLTDGGGADLLIGAVYGAFSSTDSEQDIWAYSAGGAARTASSTESYIQIGGAIQALGTYTEAQARVKPGFAGTAKNIRCYLSANTYTDAGTLKLMLNGTAVITVTITAGGGAGWYENTSDSVAFDADDELSLEFDEGTSGSITIKMAGLTLAAGTSTAVAGPLVDSSRLLTGSLISGRLVQ